MKKPKFERMADVSLDQSTPPKELLFSSYIAEAAIMGRFVVSRPTTEFDQRYAQHEIRNLLEASMYSTARENTPFLNPTLLAYLS